MSEGPEAGRKINLSRDRRSFTKAGTQIKRKKEAQNNPSEVIETMCMCVWGRRGICG